MKTHLISPVLLRVPSVWEKFLKTLTKENLLDVRAEEEVQLADFLEGEVREGSSDDRSPGATPPVILIFRK